MNGPHFVEQFDQEELYKVATYTHQFNCLLRLHPSRLLHRKVYVHWINELKRSLACIGKEHCPHCKTIGREPRCYAPGIEWHNKQQKWVRRVIPVNASCLHVLEMDLGSLSFLCKRTYAAKNAPVAMVVALPTVKVMNVPDFDITPTLLRMWGCQTRVE